MTILSILITWATLLPVGLQQYRETIQASHYQSLNPQAATTDSEQARQTVTSFLSWYKTHMQAVNRFPLVNQQAGKPYSVNLKNGERYLAYLKSSHLLTDTYLSQWRTYFTERNAGFRLTPQDEGPPDGFEYDLVMLTQDVDKQLASLKSLKINKTTIVKNKATVVLTLLGAYEFRLIRQNNRWLINEILNTGEE